MSASSNINYNRANAPTNSQPGVNNVNNNISGSSPVTVVSMLLANYSQSDAWAKLKQKSAEAVVAGLHGFIVGMVSDWDQRTLYQFKVHTFAPIPLTVEYMDEQLQKKSFDLTGPCSFEISLTRSGEKIGLVFYDSFDNTQGDTLLFLPLDMSSGSIPPQLSDIILNVAPYALGCYMVRDGAKKLYLSTPEFSNKAAPRGGDMF